MMRLAGLVMALACAARPEDAARARRELDAVRRERLLATEAEREAAGRALRIARAVEERLARLEREVAGLAATGDDPVSRDRKLAAEGKGKLAAAPPPGQAEQPGPAAAEAPRKPAKAAAKAPAKAPPKLSPAELSARERALAEKRLKLEAKAAAQERRLEAKQRPARYADQLDRAEKWSLDAVEQRVLGQEQLRQGIARMILDLAERMEREEKEGRK